MMESGCDTAITHHSRVGQLLQQDKTCSRSLLVCGVLGAAVLSYQLTLLMSSNGQSTM